MARYVIGMDLGSDSVRAILIEINNKGKEIGSSTAFYPRWAEGKYCDSSINQFRQHPLDYIESVEKVLREIISICPNPNAIEAISVDTTASTPCLVDKNLLPLSLNPEFEHNPDAMFILWKDHTAEKEAKEINDIMPVFKQNYAAQNGGIYSPENFWSKLLHVLRKDEKLREAAFSAIELCDFIPNLLCGNHNPQQLKMSHCVAACKCMWSETWEGYPPEMFFRKVDSVLTPIMNNLPKKNYYCNEIAGTLCEEWAKKLGLPKTVKIGVGNIDSYSGAIGAGIEYKKMIMNLGTSACYMCVVPNEILKGKFIEGVFGQADSTLIEGYNGFEIGLSSYGDAFAWCQRLLAWTIDKYLPEEARKEIKDKILQGLNEEALQLKITENSPIATDHFNGRRSPYLNAELKASITNLKISTTPAEIFYAIVEATAFATKVILDHLKNNGVVIEELIAVGGVAHKSPLAMQLMADVTNCKIDICSSKNAGALGAAIYASIIAGIYPNLEEAQKAICPEIAKTYLPDSTKRDILDKRYQKYLKLVDFNSSLNPKNK